MDSAIVTESVKEAWVRTRTLLLTDPDIGRWLKYGFIAMLGAGALGSSGGGTSVQVPVGGPGGGGGEWTAPGGMGPQMMGALRDALTWLAANIANLLLLALGLVIVSVIVALLVLYIRSVFRFIFVDAVAAPREPGVIESWNRHTGQGLSLLIWYLLLGLIPLVLIVIALVPIIGSIGLLASGEPVGALLGVGGMLGMGGMIFIALLLLAVGRALTEDFLVPAMYVRRSGIVSGWRHVAGAWRGQLGNVVLFYLLKLLLGIGAAIVTGIIGMLSLLLLIIPAISLGVVVGLIAASGMASNVTWIALGAPVLTALILGGGVFGYIMNVLLLPVSMFFQAYALAFVGRLDASLRTI
ncbi:MAG: DUF7544 domain-containing protein [Armatimonadota bacterium]|jgi:hypothetical protein